MKKIVAIVIAAIMSIGIAGTCFAADVDLKSMSVEELIALKEAVVNELKERGELVDDAIGSGIFVVGRDIKEGVFLITNTAEQFFTYLLYDSEEDKEANKALDRGNVYSGGTVTVNLHEGQVLNLQAVTSATIVEQAAPSWAP